MVLDFLSTTDVGRIAPIPAEEGEPSEASEYELWERRERGEERLGAKGEEQPLFLLTPSFAVSAEEVWGVEYLSLCFGVEYLSLCFPLHFL